MTDYRDILRQEGHLVEGDGHCPLCWEQALREVRMFGGQPLDRYWKIARDALNEAKKKAAA